MSELGSASYKVGFDAKPFIDGMKQMIQSMRDALTQSTAFKAALAAVGAAAAALPKLLQATVAGVSALYDQFKMFAGAGAFFSKIGPPLEELKKILAAVGGATASTFRDIGIAAVGLGRHLTDLVGITNSTKTAIDGGGGGGGVTGAMESFAKWMREGGAVAGFVAGIIGSVVLPVFANLATTIAERLNPDLSAFATEVRHISSAMADLQASQKEFANAFQAGQEKATLFTDALANVKANLIGTAAPFAELLGTMGAFGGIAASVAAKFLSLLGTVANFAGVILVLKALLAQQFFVDFLKGMGITAGATTSLIALFKSLATVLYATFITVLKEAGQALLALVPKLAIVRTAFLGLSATLGLSPGGLALIAGTVLVGAFVGLVATFNKVNAAADQHMSVIDKLIKREEELGKSIRNSLQAMQDQTAQLLAQQTQALEQPFAARDALQEQFDKIERDRKQQREDYIRSLEKEGRLSKDELEAIKLQVEAEGEKQSFLNNNLHTLELYRVTLEEVSKEHAKQLATLDETQATRQQAIEAERSSIAVRLQELQILGESKKVDNERRQLRARDVELEKQLTGLQTERTQLLKQQGEQTKANLEYQQEMAKAFLKNTEDLDRAIVNAETRLQKTKKDASDLTKLAEKASTFSLGDAGGSEYVAQQLREQANTQAQFVKLQEQYVETLKKARDEARENANASHLNEETLRRINAAAAQYGVELGRIGTKQKELAATQKQISADVSGELRDIQRRREEIAHTAELRQQEAQTTQQNLDLEQQRLQNQQALLQSENDFQKNREQLRTIQTQLLAIEQQKVEKHRETLKATIETTRATLALQDAALKIRESVEQGSDATKDQRHEIESTRATLATMESQWRAIGGQLEAIGGQLEAHKKNIDDILHLLELQIQQHDHEARLRQANIEIATKGVELEKTRIENQIAYTQGEDYTLKIQQKVLELQRQQLALERQLIEKKRDSLQVAIDLQKANLASMRSALSEAEATDKASKQTKDLAKNVEEAAAQLGVAEKEASKLAGDFETASTKAAMLERDIDRIGKVAINFGDTFRTAFNEGFDAVVLGTRKLSDVFQGMKVSAIRQVGDMFAQMVQKKLGFDTLWQKNWLQDLPGMVQGGVGSMLSSVGSFFKAITGMGSATGGGGGGFFSSLGSLFGSGSGQGAPTGGGGFLSGAGSILSSLPVLGGLFGGGGGGGLGSLFGQGSALGGIFGSPAQSLPAGVFGPAAPGTGIFSGGGLGNLAGGLLGNFGGGLLSNALGIGGTGANIGGLIGGLAGNLIPIPVIGPMIGAFIGNLLGGAIGSLFKPQRIATEKKALEQELEPILGIDVPRKNTQKYLPEADKKFGSLKSDLSAIGVGTALDSEEGGIGTLKRFANLAVAAFEKAGLSIEEAKQKVLDVAQAVGFTLTSAFKDLNNALDGGFGDKKNRLSLKEYNEEVKEGQKDIQTYGGLLKGTFDVLSGFTDKVDAGVVANKLLADSFEKTAKSEGDFNDTLKDLAEQVRQGKMPVEEAINKYNELRKAQGKSALDLKDFKVDINTARIEYLKFGIALDETSQKFLETAGVFQGIADSIKQVTAQIAEMGRAIQGLQLERVRSALNIDATIRKAKSDDVSNADLTRQEREKLLLPAFLSTSGGISLQDYAGALSTPDALKDLSLDDLQRQGAGIDAIIQSFISEFDQALQEKATALQKSQEETTKKLTETATAATEQIQMGLQAEEKLAQAQAKRWQAELRAEEKLASERIKSWQKEGEQLRKTTETTLKGLQEQLQAAQAFKQLGESLKQNIVQLAGSNLAPETPYGRFGFLEREAQSIRDQMVGTSGTGRAQLVSELQGLLNQQAQQIPYQRPENDYKKVFDGIILELSSLRDEAVTAGEDADRLQQQILNVQQDVENQLEQLNTQIEGEQGRIDRMREDISNRIEAEQERIEALRESAEQRLEAIRDQLETDLKTLEATTKKQFDDFRAQRAEELEKQLTELKGTKDANLAAQIAKSEEIRAALEKQRNDLIIYQGKVEQALADMLGIQIPEVRRLLATIAQNTGTSGSSAGTTTGATTSTTTGTSGGTSGSILLPIDQGRDRSGLPQYPTGWDPGSQPGLKLVPGKGWVSAQSGADVTWDARTNTYYWHGMPLTSEEVQRLTEFGAQQAKAPGTIYAASGYSGVVNKETQLTVGEGGKPEFVFVQPLQGVMGQMRDGVSAALSSLRSDMAPAPQAASPARAMQPISTASTMIFNTSNNFVIHPPAGTQLDERLLAANIVQLSLEANERSMKYGKLGQLTKSVVGRSA